MARPERNNVDYFPFICEDGNKMFYIEETYGNDGFATFVKLLRELARTNYHYLDLSKPSMMMFLSAKCKVSKEVLESIIKDLVEIGKFDDILWNENKIIWCQDFIDSIQDAYLKRNNKCITLPALRILLNSLGVLKPSKLQPKGVINTQRREEYRREEKSIEKEIKIEHVKTYFLENGYSEISAQKFFDYYSVASWKDSKGNKVKNWKQKAQSVWFKPENKISDSNAPLKMVY